MLNPGGNELHLEPQEPPSTPDYTRAERFLTWNTRALVYGDVVAPHWMSGGNQQKVVIARWLLRDYSVLLFDEPTRGIDP